MLLREQHFLLSFTLLLEYRLFIGVVSLDNVTVYFR